MMAGVFIYFLIIICLSSKLTLTHIKIYLGNSPLDLIGRFNPKVQ